MNAKSAFLSDKELAAKWNGIAKDPDFRKVIIYAEALFLESNPSTEMCVGARRMITDLVSLAENELSELPFPEPNVSHHRETMPEKED